MAPKGRSSLSAFLADLSNPNAAGDFDPEAGALGNGLLRGSAFSMVDADGNAASGSDDSGSEASEDEATAIRRGYVQVGQGAVKKGLELDLGDKYAGKKASRAALLGEEGSDNDDENDDEDMDGEGFEDEAQGSEEDGPEDTVDEGSDDNGAEVEMSEDDDEDDEGMDLRSLARQLSANGKASKSSKAAAPAESDSEGSGEESEVSEEESEQSAASEDEQTATTTKKRSRLKDVNAELRELEKEEEELLKSLSANARADVEKGRHVRAQIQIYESLLDLRIKLQPSLQLVNRLPPHDFLPSFLHSTSDEPHPTPKDGLHEIRSELSHVLADLTTLRLELLARSPGFPQDKLPENRKRKSHPNQHLDDKYRDLAELDSLLQGYRDETLDKWWTKAHGASVATTKFKAVNQTASAQVRAVLQDTDRLRKRTRLWRTGEEQRALGRSEKKSEEPDAHLKNEDAEIFDDGDFYSTMLKELIDSRATSSSLDPTQMASSALLLKQLQERRKAGKKKVDTKASKGRKIRYEVMDKLRNFMAPREVPDMQEELKDELFGNLFGMKGQLGGQKEVKGKVVKEVEVADPGFKLFG